MISRKTWMGIVPFAAAFLLACTLLGALYVRELAAEYIRGGMPDDAIMVAPASLSLGPIALGGAVMNTNLASELSARADVRAVAEEITLGLPARVEGSVFGHGYGSDVAVIGLDSASLVWLAPDISGSTWSDIEPLPVLVPRAILDAYNSSFAPANGLPLLTQSAFVGQSFRLEVGISSLRTIESSRASIPAELRGFSRRSDILGVIVPLEFVRRINITTGAPGSTRLIVFPKDPSAAESLTADLKARGLAVTAPTDRLHNLKRLDITILVTISTAVAILAFFSIISSIFMTAAVLLERKEEAELYHQLGLSRLQIIALFVRHVVGPAIASSLAGACVAAVLLPPASNLASSYMPLPIALPLPHILFAIAFASACVPVVSTFMGCLHGGRIVIPAWEER